MVDLTITPASVQPGSGKTISATALEDIDAGELFYLDTNGKASLVDVTDPLKDEIAGIATNSAAAGQKVLGQKGGSLVIGAGSQGVVYAASAGAPGKIAPIADIVSTEGVSIVGVGDGANGLVLGNGFNNSGVVVA